MGGVGGFFWLEENEAVPSFPDPEKAADDCGGIVAVGGDLSAPRLLCAYRNGIFPWYEEPMPITWWSPSIRMVLFPEELHVSRSLRKTLHKNVFTVSCNRNFAGVIRQCADTRAQTGTWLGADMIAAYTDLHGMGYVHSIETWCEGELAGGLYGVNVGRTFFGESMFSLRTDASKVAFVFMVSICRELGIQMIDCQLPSAHLATLGCTHIPRSMFLGLLRRYNRAGRPTDWAREERVTAGLTA